MIGTSFYGPPSLLSDASLDDDVPPWDCDDAIAYPPREFVDAEEGEIHRKV